VFLALEFFPHYKNNFHAHIRDDHSNKLTRFHFCGGGKALIFSSDELHPYASADLNEQQYQFQHCVKKITSKNYILMMVMYCGCVPLMYLPPKLTLKAVKELANLHDMYMPSKILLKNAQMLLEITNVKHVQNFLWCLNLIN